MARIIAQPGERNPEFVEALRDRIFHRMSPDHVWEQQLGGPDDMSSLHILDRRVNYYFEREIRRQIRKLPDYAPTTVTIEGTPE